MKLMHRGLATAGLAAALATASPPARALVTLEDGADKIFVTGTAGIAYNSNVFQNSGSGGSITYSSSLGIEFVRRAGWIGVNASLVWNFTEYAKYSAQNFADPTFTTEFDKSTGRTTGALTLIVQKQNRSDVDVNTIDASWNYTAGLTARYPVIDRYSFVGGVNYSYTDYSDQKLFSNLSQVAANLDLYYILSDERDLFAGYRYRYSESSNVSSDVDHDVYAGISGRIIPGINGSLSVGYQIRLPYEHDMTAGGTEGDYSVAGSATYNFDKKTTLTGTLSKDFGVTATAVSIDTETATLNATYAYNAKYSVFATVGGGETRFLGVNGEVTTGGPQRLDYNLTWSVGLAYTLNEHFKATLTYTYVRNWSNLNIADFPGNTLSLNLSSRW